MSVTLYLIAQVLASPSPGAYYASDAQFTCEFYTPTGDQKTVVGRIDPIKDATGYGAAPFKLERDDTGLMQGAQSATLTGSPKLPRWYQISVPVAGGKEHMMQLYLNGHGVVGNGFITLQEGDLRIGGYGTLASGFCHSNFGAVK